MTGFIRCSVAAVLVVAFWLPACGEGASGPDDTNENQVNQNDGNDNQNNGNANGNANANGSVCGDGVAASDEACDGTDLKGATCEGLGFAVGALACSEECQVETTGCVTADEILVGPGQRPGIAVAHDGSVHLAYVIEGTNGGVYYRRYANGSFEPEELIHAGKAHWPKVALSSDGDVNVVWEKGPMADEIWYARRVAGVWTELRLHSGVRALMPKIGMDSQGRAHVIFWEIHKDDPVLTNLGRYRRVVLTAGNLSIDLSKDVDDWNPNRDGDLVVDASDVVHVFTGRLNGVNHATVSEQGSFTALDWMHMPAGVTSKTGELFDVVEGPGGVFYAGSAGINLDGTEPAVHYRSSGAGTLVWPDIGDAHTAVTVAADLVVPGRAYLIFADLDCLGRIAVVDGDGTLIGPAPFADAGQQYPVTNLPRFSSVGAGVPGEEGLWIAYQDNRSGSWEVYLRRLTAPLIQAQL